MGTTPILGGNRQGCKFDRHPFQFLHYITLTFKNWVWKTKPRRDIMLHVWVKHILWGMISLAASGVPAPGAALFFLYLYHDLFHKKIQYFQGFQRLEHMEQISVFL